jgi:hypothetical protein
MVVMVDPFTWGVESIKRNNANIVLRKQKSRASARLAGRAPKQPSSRSRRGGDHSASDGGAMVCHEAI